MVTVQGTNRIKGVLNLSSINQQVVKEQVIYLRDDDYWKTDVQTALKMGWLVSKGSPQQGETYQTDGSSDRKIRCENIWHRPISINQNLKEIRPGQEFVLSEKDMDSPAVRTAVSKNMIRPLGVATGSSSSSEGRVLVQKRLEGVSLPEPSPETMSQYNPEPFRQDKEGIVRINLDSNEELSNPSVIKDDRGVVWNKTVEISGPSNVIVDEHPASVNPNVGDPKRTSIVVDPNGTRYNSNIVNRDQDITFVDEVERQRKIASHPKLKDHHHREDEGTLLITDLNNDEARIAAHPVLSKKMADIDSGIDDI